MSEPSRWVVLDVEATGLDAGRDSLLALAAVAVHRHDEGLRLVPADSFEAVLRHVATNPGEAAKANALLHGIGLGAQRQGDDPGAALRAFAAWAGAAPLLGFHVGFDRRLLDRACRRHAPEAALRGPWIDIEALAVVSHPGRARGALDDWLAHFHIPCAQRHQAAADTLATAELLLRLWPRLLAELPARRRQQGTVAALTRLQAARRWIQ